MKKKLLLVLMLIAAVVVMPRVYAEEIEVTISDITSNDSLQSTKPENSVEKDENGNYTITYDVATFKLLNGVESGRPDNKAWIGFRVTLPTTGISKYTIKNETASKDIVKDGEVHGDSDKDVDVYAGFDVADLTSAAEKGENVEINYTLSITPSEPENTTIEKTIKVVIAPKGITLKDKNNSETEVWNAEKYEEKVKKVKVTIKVMKDGKEETLPETAITEYTLKEVYTLTEEQLSAIKSLLTDENLELVGLYTDPELKTELDTTKALDTDVIVYVAYKTKVEEPAPNTVDNAVMYIALAGASLLVAGIIAVHFKKANE